jgi:hypothetical protein
VEPIAQLPATVLVELTDWTGSQLATVADLDEFVRGVVLEAGSESVLLRYVKANGYLVLNDVQMDDFLSDWEQVERFVISAHDRSTWEGVRGLALRCRAEPLMFLRFIGD